MNGRFLGSSACAIVLAFSVAACGGGGGGGGGGVKPLPPPPTVTPSPTPSPTPTPTPTPPPPTPGPSAYDTAEYQRSNYSVAANALAAYDAGATGKGVKIGIIDSGINPNLPEFAGIGKIDPASGDVASNRGVSDEGGHGTAVSAVAAAARNGLNTMGVAFDATIISERADDPGSCGGTDGCSFYDNDIAAGIDAARLAGAKVINMSLGGSAPGPVLLSAINNAVKAGIVIVISAGNDGEKPEGVNPDPFALTPAQQFPGMVIIAGSIGDDNGVGGIDTSVISYFSNRAGSGANSYLMALGYHDLAPNIKTGGYAYWSGTSFSAPTISGAVALLAQAFPNLKGSEIVSILFQSADDLGAPGIDSIYGRGRLNIARAFQPIGQTSMADSEIPVSTYQNGDLPGAAGDAGKVGSLGAVILDGYSRAFVLNLARTLREAPKDLPLTHALQGDVKVAGAAAGPISVAMTVSQRHDLPLGFELERMGIGPDDARRARLIAGSAVARLDRKTAVAFGFAEGAKAMERRLNGAEAGAFLIAKDVAGDPGFAARRNGSVAMRHEFGGTGFTFSGESGSVWQDQDFRNSAYGSPYRWTSVAVDRHVGRNWLSAGIGRLEEKQTLLGGRMSDVLGGGGANTTFADLEARHEFGGGWSAGLTARHGWTAFAGGKFQTSAYGVDVSKAALLSDHDKIGFRLAQPLRVESGGFAMLLPTSYSYETGTATDSLSRFSLTPSGRELDAELSYGSSLFDGNGWLGANLFARRQPGHIADAKNDVGAAIRFTLGF
jgi:subtilisin family serine protease